MTLRAANSAPEFGRMFQLSFDIQLAITPPISFGESSWMKGFPFTVTSLREGHERAVARLAPAARSAPGSAFTKSFGIWVVANQALYAETISATSGGSPSIGISLGKVNVGHCP